MTDRENQRRYPRVKVPKSALVAWKNGCHKSVSPVENLALGGLFIRTKTPAIVGTMLQLVFNTPQGEVRVRATVRVVKPGEGTIECHDQPVTQQATKQLPSSD